ncbi:plasma membrane fusion protein prm1 [Aspergillus coremiiformis]|uniref:Plasma membrane fusion protein PRM1 n=1 Tax=Aspergillus coremiiformis TaxID=138285 RepID=A0A5N6ZF37_9EURO|nr:plasma membrane fusion protein prm1 [Aspergillus coremiiformis]
MVFSRSGRSIFPLLPPYGAHDPNDGPGRAVPLHPDGITPYLGLRARLSQVWLNRWTILLLLVLARVLIAATGIQSDMDTAKREAQSACTSVETMGSSMASMPHYLSRGVNELTASGVESAINGLISMLLLTITGVEALVIFFIKVMYQTYLCLFTMVVRGSTQAALGVIKETTEFLNKTINTIGEDIGKTVETFEGGLNKFLSGINKVSSAFGGKEVPKLDISKNVDELKGLHLPGSIDQAINKINSSIPTFDEVDKFVTDVLKFPFEEVKGLINGSLGNYTFDRSVLPVPAKEQLTFCDEGNGINSFFNKVAEILITARKIFLAVLVIAATIACIPVAWQEVRRWRTMKERSQIVRKDAHDPMDVVYIVSRPHTAGAGIKAASRFSNSRRQILVRWAIAYATSPAALFVLCLALTGLFSCLCQYLLLKTVAGTVPELSSEVGEFAQKVVTSLQNTSAKWANDTNGVIDGMSNDINNNVLGWVNTSTTAVNNTLNAFVDKTIGVLNETFGGTLLYEPLKDVFNCLIGLKVATVQKGLTWTHDHAHVKFPRVPNDILSRGADKSINNSTTASDSFLASPGDKTSNKITEVVMRVLNKIQAGIRTEAIISACIMAVWIINFLFGFIRALLLFWGRDKIRGEGGGAPINHNPDASGFTDVPLANNINAASHPAPRYEVAMKTPPVTRASGHFNEDEKMGYAGQRALKVGGRSDLRGSSYVEYGSEKR